MMTPIERPDIEARLRADLHHAPDLPGDFASSIVRFVDERSAPTPAPNFAVEASDVGVTRVRFEDQAATSGSRRQRSLVEEARHELAQYFAGERAWFSVPVDLGELSPFHRSVLGSLRNIDPGECRSYGWVAEAIGRPRAVRAVGTALGRNPVLLILPCHRVVRSDGKIGDYAGGATLKERLLDLERTVPYWVGDPTSRRLCRNGCDRSRALAPADRIVFASETEAAGVGYQRCPQCLTPPAGRSSGTAAGRPRH